MNRNLLLPLVVLLILGGALYLFTQNAPKQQQAPTTTQTENATPSEKPIDRGPVVGSYVGSLPCADCSGITETLTLKENGQFEKKDVYEGKSVEPFIENGSWNVEKNGDMTIVHLDEEQGDPQYYQYSENSLTPLDSQKKPIDSPFDMTLRKQ